MTDCIIARRGSRKTITYYVWNRYNRVSTTTYRWNRYNVNSTTTYYWDRYNVVQTTMHNWNRYDITSQTMYNYLEYYFAWDADLVQRISFGDAGISITNNTGGVLETWYGASAAYSYSIEYREDGKGISNITSTKNYIRIRHNNMSNGSDISVRDGDLFIANNTNFSSFSRTSYSITYNSALAEGYYTQVLPDTNASQDIDTNYVYLYQIVPETTGATGRSVQFAENMGDRFVQDGYCYEYQGIQVVQGPGTSYGTVNSTSSSTYPTNGASGNYWYVYTGTTTQYSQGSANGSVSSTNRSAYPDNNYQGNYWYVYDRSSTSYSQGSANGSVTSTNRTQYPDNGRSGSYWYVYSSSSTSYSQGSYIDQVTSSDRNSFPDNNYSGNYWYVYQGTAEEVVTNQASLNSILSE